MTRFSDPSDFEREAKARLSPDGNYFLVVTSRGLIESNQIESTLWIFSKDEVRSFLNAPTAATWLSPRTLATVAAIPIADAVATYSPVISNARWSPDSRAIYFLGLNSRGKRRLYRVDVKSGAAHILTPKGNDVNRFDIAGDTVAYTAFHAVKTRVSNDFGNLINADARAVTGVPIGEILCPQLDQNVERVSDLWFIRHGTAHQVVDSGSTRPERDAERSPDVLSLSPKGRLLVRLLPVDVVAPSWEMYDPAPGFESRRIPPPDSRPTPPESKEHLRQYALVDVTNGRSTPLVDAPFGDALAYWDGGQVVWSNSERRVLVTETFLPLNRVSESERSKRIHPCAVAAVELLSFQASCIVFSRDGKTTTIENPGALRVQNVSFGTSDDEVVVQFKGYQRPNQIERYQYRDGIWALIETLTSNQQGGVSSEVVGLHGAEKLSIFVRQSINNPPALWATDLTSGVCKRLWDPNPQFARLKFGEASIYHWKDKTGYQWTGGLVKPVGYLPGQQYPLIIQTHGFLDYGFMTDGSYPTAMAARPLASAGFFVLQMDYRRDHELTAAESQDQVEGFTSAINQLGEEDLIDSSRVGIIGFSRSSYHVEDALTTEPQRFAAATIVDGVDQSYMQYHLWGEGNRGLAAEFEKANGGKPFGYEGLTKWVERAPSFHLDRVAVPLRIEAIGGPLSILGEWEIYSSLRMQGKPVDLIYIPGAQHILQKPLDRFASQQGNVDWFRFWLQNYEDPDPAKLAQYKRWEELKRLRNPQK